MRHPTTPQALQESSAAEAEALRARAEAAEGRLAAEEEAHARTRQGLEAAVRFPFAFVSPALSSAVSPQSWRRRRA